MPSDRDDTFKNDKSAQNGSPSSQRINLLKTVYFDHPEVIPMIFHINESSWDYYPKEFLEEMIDRHPVLFDKGEDGAGRIELDNQIIERPGEPYTDGWGCVWKTVVRGIVGTVVSHPLENWDDFSNYQAPDPNVDSGKGPVDWELVGDVMSHCRATGRMAIGGLRHGHTFGTLADIRGYENLIYDMCDHEPRLGELIAMVEQFNYALVQKYLEAGAQWMSYAEDLGMQVGPLISADLFEQYIQPVYRRLIQPARDKGCVIHMHSDGDIRSLAESILDCGVDVVNIQDRVNGIDWIKEHLAGKVCIDLDIDRQHISREGSPADIDALIRHEVETLGSKEGGLMMIYGLYPGLSLENAEAVMDAMQRYSSYYSG